MSMVLTNVQLVNKTADEQAKQLTGAIANLRSLAIALPETADSGERFSLCTF